WDPSRDQIKLRGEFLSGYFGPAGEYLGRYLDLVNACGNDPATRIGCSNHDTYYLSAEALTKANELFDRATGAVKEDATFTARVARERIALRHLGLLRYNFAAATPATLPRYRKTAREWITDAKAAGVRNFSEAQ